MTYLYNAALHLMAVLTLPGGEAMKYSSPEVVNQILQNDPLKYIRFARSYAAPDVLGYIHDTSSWPDSSKPDDFSRALRGRDNFIRFGRGRSENFMRFGRSNAVGKEPERENKEYDRLTRSVKGNKKSEKFERLTKNFIRLGRATPDNLMRFGRGKQDNFMRFGGEKQSNFMRLGRGKQDNFMRFGRGKQDNFIRLGRGKDNFMRFGRGKQDNFMRLGRGKDNFMRFGRGKQDNFLRFGRGKEGNYLRFGRDMFNIDLPSDKENLDSNYLLLDSEDKPEAFDRHSIVTSVDNIPLSMRSSSRDNNDFDRLVRSRQDNFMRFGKSDANQQSLQSLEFSEDLNNNPSSNTDSPLLRDTFTREIKTKLHDEVNLLRQGRHPPNKDDSFIRFGRNSLDSNSANVFPKRLKRSTAEMDEYQEDVLPSRVNEGMSYRVLLPIYSLTDYREEDPSSPEQLEGYDSRRKRSVKFKTPPSTAINDRISSLSDVSTNLVDSGKLSDNFIIPLFIPPTSSSFNSEE